MSQHSFHDITQNLPCWIGQNDFARNPHAGYTKMTILKNPPCWISQNDLPLESPSLIGQNASPRNPPCWMSQHDLARNSSCWISQNDTPPESPMLDGPKRTRIHTMCQSIPWAKLEKNVPLPSQLEPLETFFEPPSNAYVGWAKTCQTYQILMNSLTI